IGPARRDHLHLLAAEAAHGVFQRLLHRSAVALPLPAAKRRAVVFEDQLVAGHGVPSRAPTGRRNPRRKASADIGLPPARCTLVSRSAPSPQAMVRRSSSTSPGEPAPAAISPSSTSRRSPSISVQQPGQGLSARSWRSRSAAGRDQSRRPSALSILAA